MGKKELHYFIINKPYGVLSQFTDEGGNPGLGSIYSLPKDIYPVGRLDRDSEGLLILTNDGSLNKKLLSPANNHERTYLIEVEGNPTNENLKKLRRGVEINLKGKVHKCKPCKVQVLDAIPFEEREPSVNRVKHPETSWLRIGLTEGKNRQVRRISAKVGHPTLRLVRVSIESLDLGEMASGGITQISRKAIYKKLGIPT